MHAPYVERSLLMRTWMEAMRRGLHSGLSSSATTASRAGMPRVVHTGRGSWGCTSPILPTSTLQQHFCELFEAPLCAHCVHSRPAAADASMAFTCGHTGSTRLLSNRVLSVTSRQLAHLQLTTAKQPVLRKLGLKGCVHLFRRRVGAVCMWVQLPSGASSPDAEGTRSWPRLRALCRSLRPCASEGWAMAANRRRAALSSFTFRAHPARPEPSPCA